MDYDFVIIGAGPAGEAAAREARAHGASPAVDGPEIVADFPATARVLRAFPSTSRIFDGRFKDARNELNGETGAARPSTEQMPA